MPKLEELNRKVARAKQKKATKAEPVKVAEPAPDVLGAVARGFEELNKAVSELTTHSSGGEVKVVVDTQPIAEAVGRAILNIPAPVVNIPERKPVEYYAKVDRNSRGDMVGAHITPVE